MPFLIIVYLFAYIDRTNLSFAKLQMQGDLGFNDAIIGFGAGIFFIGYFLLEVPGTLIVERWSARKWLAGITIVWGKSRPLQDCCAFLFSAAVATTCSASMSCDFC